MSSSSRTGLPPLPFTTHDIGTDLLRTMIFVVEERSYTKAALRLGLSQPTVSAHIKRLQDQLGYDIFDKSVPGVKLTSQGEFVLSRAQQMLAMHEQMLRGPGKSDGPMIRIGVPEEILSLAPAMATIRRDNPAVKFSVDRNTPAKLRRQFYAGEIDVCAVLDRHDRLEDATIRGQDVLVWAGLKLNKTPAAPVSIVAPPRHCISNEIMLETLAAHGIHYRVAVQAGTLNGAVNSAAAGLGYLALLRATLPASLTEIGRERGLPPITLPFFWGVYVNRNAWASAAEYLADFLALELGQRQPLAASGGRR